MPTFKFKIGAFVKRKIDVYDPKSKWKHGVVVRAYSKRSILGFSPELYDVDWTSPGPVTRECGLLPHGMDHDPGK